MSTTDKPLALALVLADELKTDMAWLRETQCLAIASMYGAEEELRRLAEVERERNKLLGELKRVKGICTDVTTACQAHLRRILDLEAERDALRAEVERFEADRQDAQRYRWLVAHYATGEVWNAIDAALQNGEVVDKLSEAIDAAMLAATPPAPVAQPLTRVEIRQTAAGFEARGVSAAPAAPAAPVSQPAGDQNSVHFSLPAEWSVTLSKLNPAQQAGGPVGMHCSACGHWQASSPAAARVPLTEEQIVHLPGLPADYYLTEVIQIVRATERAHGIGEEFRSAPPNPNAGLGIPACGGPLCSEADHHPLCAKSAPPCRAPTQEEHDAAIKQIMDVFEDDDDLEVGSK